MSRYPVFIVGSPRSGTSILVDVLLSAGYHGFREGNFLSILRSFHTVIDRHLSVFGADGAPVLAAQVDGAALKASIDQNVRSIVEALNPVTPWFDKSGNADMIEAIPSLRALWPDCVFIFARRRGIENVISRLRKFPGHGFEYHCMDWAKNMRAWRSMRADMPAHSFIEVDQQDMVQAPGATARRIAALLRVNGGGATAMAETMQHNRPQQTGAGSTNRVYALQETGWSAPQQQVFLKHCAAEMEAFGYTTNTSYRSAETAIAG